MAMKYLENNMAKRTACPCTYFDMHPLPIGHASFGALEISHLPRDLTRPSH